MQSVASSAGATTTSSIVNQPFNGHLNGRPSDPFDQEECYARCTVAATCAQSLTVIISQLDMAGMMGMMQILAGRARPVHQVYHGATTWTLSKLDGMTHQEQSDAEVALWNISHVSHGQSKPCLRWHWSISIALWNRASDQAQGPGITISPRKGLLVQGHLARSSSCCHIGPCQKQRSTTRRPLFDVFARMLGPGVRRVQARGHQLSLVSVMCTSLSPFG